MNHDNRHQKGKSYGSGNDRRPSAPTLNELHSAYNFVPLSDWVHCPDWAEAISHDHPFADGLSGCIEFTLTSHTRLLVGDCRDGAGQPVRFFRMPGANNQAGQYAIPGTTLRGMVRNVLEIASFAKFRTVDNQKLGFRDLTSGVSQEYQKKFAKTESDGAYSARSRAAWLWFKNGEWLIEPCPHVRVEQEIIKRYAGTLWPLNGDPAKKSWRPSALEKYRDVEGNAPLSVRFNTTGSKESHPHSGKLLSYIKCTGLARREGENPFKGKAKTMLGRLVFTGQPGPQKHMEFVFSEPGQLAKQKPLPAHIIPDFLAIYSKTDEWQYWNQKVQRGEPVPIFYLQENPNDLNSAVSAIGLSQMFKLPYKLSLHQTIQNSGKSHLDESRPDFVEGIFGYLDDEGGSLRSRVSFSVAQVVGVPKESTPVATVLNNPKPTYYPAYLKQKETSGKLGSPQYNTLMNEEAQLRGWKRYPVKNQETITPPTGNEKVDVKLIPLEKGARFKGKMRFHNLRPVELGGLLWALTWGGDATKRHALGMGKPMGFGQISVEIDAAACQMLPNATEAAPAIAELIETFRQHMETATKKTGKPGWQNPTQLRELLAMADPARAQGKNLSALCLGRNRDDNEFLNAKKNRLVLPAYTQIQTQAR